ncbi:zinc finger protein, putative [Plasmodium berghei]|uniref:Zinc finger protein, putative n=2 Tax=Plasmodium berghei TaxID=5821 RepID=A0A509APJ3_PLABA|nr:zinc finger protein, putative [Plasmodium berghei ANKA]CXI67483.1 zinc finger protein, putative [Plasmodium berghei]SCM24127.1 zinc finger protein, putative [Plasmodium berghei]SCN26939.1 zinc finger protein, putative [Plasmodium berghei]SCO61380.1 zinc finger protein, putative [Plasmodium berghei]SCO63360.1 zinc finger protein, putative [Plasmodium berghei]|eukprot:XP_034422555.1 zinc finger protein, putative [Plasmodium berghei ANKA]
MEIALSNENIKKDIETHNEIAHDTIEVKSMCINCEQEGINKILKFEIPYFKNILIHSFECVLCNYRNNTIQDLNPIKEKGVKILFSVTKTEHLDRQLIKSEYGVLKIPEINFEIPKETQKGSINTIEGFIQTALSNLTDYFINLKNMYNEANNIVDDNENNESKEVEKNVNDDIHKIEEKEQLNKDGEINDINNNNYSDKDDENTSDVNEKCHQITIENYMSMIEKTIHKLSRFIVSKELPFTVEIIDPSGLSSLEYYDEDINSKTVVIEHYQRSKQELNELGFYEEDFEGKKKDENFKQNNLNINENQSIDKGDQIKKENFDFIKKYVHMNNNSNGSNNMCVKYKTINEGEENKLIESFTSNCPCCNYLGDNNFCEINIPGFKKCLILSYVCPNCNYKTSEIKSSGEINPKGKKITLTVKNKSDLNRFVIKSETASIQIPIIDLTSDYGTLGGSLTTVEGIIIQIIESLEDKFKFLLGDSSINTHISNDEVNASNKDDSVTNKIKNVISNLYKLCRTEEMFPFDLIIDDIASNSYISCDQIGDDTNLKEEEYERNFEQNDMLGITSMDAN